MKIYQVGGCVRDKLLGLTPKDIDYVVVGSTPQQMLDLGYQQVGSSFPVFLKDGEEYALARTERKTGVGYNGFETKHDPNVTLEDDLCRRDLTINSMAMDEDGHLFDPHGGQSDLQAQILRHTSEAFAEDPVRVLRTARFAARYKFDIAPDTIELMNKIAHELDFIPQERIWTEIEKGLMEKTPAVMFDTLTRCGAFTRSDALKPYCKYSSNRLWQVTSEHDLIVRFVLISHAFADDDYTTCRIPNDCAEVSRTFNKHFNDFVHYSFFTTAQCLDVLYEMRAFSGSAMVMQKCVETLALFPELDVQLSMIMSDWKNAKSVDAASIAIKCTTGQQIKEAIYSARLTAL